MVDQRLNDIPRPNRISRIQHADPDGISYSRSGGAGLHGTTLVVCASNQVTSAGPQFQNLLCSDCLYSFVCFLSTFIYLPNPWILATLAVHLGSGRLWIMRP